MKNIAETIDLNAMTMEYGECEKHGKYVIATVINGIREKLECPQCIDLREQQANFAEQKKRADAERKKSRELSGVPERFRQKTIASYAMRCGDNQARIVDICRRYADGIAERIRVGTSMIFCGSVGTGKTHLAAAIANRALDEGFDAIFTTAIKAARAVKNTYNKSSTKTEQQVINELATADLLVLDEIGIQLGTDTEKTILFEIINERYERCKPTIVISNFDPEGLEQHLGERVVSRLKDGGVQLFFDWSDYRKGGAQ